MEYLRVKDLIEILQQYDGKLPVIVTDGGKNHQYGISKSGIKILNSAYFGNDQEAGEYFEKDLTEEEQEKQKFLNLGSF